MKDKIERILNLYPEVKWDRFAGALSDKCVFYGWVERDDHRTDLRRDFLTLIFDHGEVQSLTTSSAVYSAAFAERVFGQTEDHFPCLRVEQFFPNVNSIALGQGS